MLNDAFKPFTLGSLKLNNRFVMAPVWMGMADEKGGVTDHLVEHYREIAASGIGLIITEYAFIKSGHQILPRMLGIGEDSQIEGLKRIVKAVHKEGAKIFIQLADCGFNSDPKYNPEGLIYGPSIIDLKGYSEAESMGVLTNENKHVIRALSLEQIREKVKFFGEAAARALKAGFDGVELHAAHSYLISQFLSDLYNKRCDEYGGSLENKMRFLVEVYSEVRKILGSKPISVRLNGEDGVAGGITIDETVQVAKRLEKLGCELLSVSGGTPEKTGVLKEEEEAYFSCFSKKIKKNVKTPILLTGGIRTPKIIDKLLKEKACDLIGLARPLIAEPGLLLRWRSGDLRKAKCISCNKCFYEEGLSKYVNCPVFK
ncbi:MAG: NADH:flavin oxidoreductase [Candidatus Odinarchaeota archaeon]